MKDGYEIKDSNQRRKFGTGAVRDMSSGKGRFDLVPWRVVRAIAIHYEKGCLKYGDRNWEKGIPVASFLDSGIRHAAQVIDGRNDENHLIAAIWNLMCAYETILRIQDGQFSPDLYNLPRKITLPDPYGEYGIDGWVDGKPNIIAATEAKLKEFKQLTQEQKES
jgi:hypothetical protein